MNWSMLLATRQLRRIFSRFVKGDLSFRELRYEATGTTYVLRGMDQVRIVAFTKN